MTVHRAQDEVASPPSRERLESLTSLRFFAAAMIVAVHSVYVFWPGASWPTSSFVAAVTFFFILSGFILAHVYPSLASVGTRQFLAARVARIWPAHIVVLLLLILLLPSGAWSEIAGVHHSSVGMALANIFLIHAWIPRLSYNSGFNAVSWSISTEFAFYLCFPLLIRDWHRTWWWKLAGTFALLCAMTTVANRAPLSHDVRFFLIYFNPAARLFEFTLGMALAPIARHLRLHARARPQWWTVAEIVAVAATAISVTWATKWGAAMVEWPWVGTWGTVWLQLGGICIPAMAGLVFIISLQGGYVSRLLQWRALVLLGEVSYSVYLLHQVLLRAYTHHLNAHIAGHVSAWAVYVLFWLVLVVASYLIWWRLERPLRIFFVRTMTQRWRRPIEATVVPTQQ